MPPSATLAHIADISADAATDPAGSSSARTELRRLETTGDVSQIAANLHAVSDKAVRDYAAYSVPPNRESAYDGETSLISAEGMCFTLWLHGIWTLASKEDSVRLPRGRLLSITDLCNLEDKYADDPPPPGSQDASFLERLQTTLPPDMPPLADVPDGHMPCVDSVIIDPARLYACLCEVGRGILDSGNALRSYVESLLVKYPFATRCIIPFEMTDMFPNGARAVRSKDRSIDSRKVQPLDPSKYRRAQQFEEPEHPDGRPFSFDELKTYWRSLIATDSLRKDLNTWISMELAKTILITGKVRLEINGITVNRFLEARGHGTADAPTRRLPWDFVRIPWRETPFDRANAENMVMDTPVCLHIFAPPNVEGALDIDDFTTKDLTDYVQPKMLNTYPVIQAGEFLSQAACIIRTSEEAQTFLVDTHDPEALCVFTGYEPRNFDAMAPGFAFITDRYQRRIGRKPQIRRPRTDSERIESVSNSASIHRKLTTKGKHAESTARTIPLTAGMHHRNELVTSAVNEAAASLSDPNDDAELHTIPPLHTILLTLPPPSPSAFMRSPGAIRFLLQRERTDDLNESNTMNAVREAWGTDASPLDVISLLPPPDGRAPPLHVGRFVKRLIEFFRENAPSVSDPVATFLMITAMSGNGFVRPSNQRSTNDILTTLRIPSPIPHCGFPRLWKAFFAVSGRIFSSVSHEVTINRPDLSLEPLGIEYVFGAGDDVIGMHPHSQSWFALFMEAIRDVHGLPPERDSTDIAFQIASFMTKIDRPSANYGGNGSRYAPTGHSVRNTPSASASAISYYTTGCLNLYSTTIDQRRRSEWGSPADRLGPGTPAQDSEADAGRRDKESIERRESAPIAKKMWALIATAKASPGWEDTARKDPATLEQVRSDMHAATIEAETHGFTDDDWMAAHGPHPSFSRSPATSTNSQASIPSARRIAVVVQQCLYHTLYTLNCSVPSTNDTGAFVDPGITDASSISLWGWTQYGGVYRSAESVVTLQ